MSASEPQAGQTTFQRIQSAALETFAQHGYEATGIRQVAERAGIPTSLLYHYSRSKTQLLRILVEDGLKRLVRADRLALGLATDAASRLAALAAVHVFVHAQNARMAKLLDTELRVLDGEDRATVLQLRDEIDAIWREVLEQGAAEGAFRIADTGVARLALIRMCNGVATWYSPAGRLDVVTLAGLFGGLVLGACGYTGGGQQLVDLEQVRRIVEEVHEGMPGLNPGTEITPANGAERRKS